MDAPIAKGASKPSTPTMGDNETGSVRVVLRVRPLNKSEKVVASEICLSADDCPDEHTVMLHSFDKKRGRQDLRHGLGTPGKSSPLGSPRTSRVSTSHFEFHRVLWEDSTQQEAFAASTEPLLPKFVEGYNGTAFAYGQTGSGKTYTMSGPPNTEQRGVVYRTLERLFELLDRNSALQPVKYELSGSSFELYNEQLVDLLAPSKPGAPLRMVEDPKRGVHIAGLSSRMLRSMGDATALINKAQSARSCAATQMNAESSRSHTVLSLSLRAQVSSGGVQTSRWSHLHLVDLAGSERQKVSATAGQRLKEGIAINSSLTSLGKVIGTCDTVGWLQLTGCWGTDALVCKSKHVPYRESKLTFFLKVTSPPAGGVLSVCVGFPWRELQHLLNCDCIGGSQL